MNSQNGDQEDRKWYDVDVQCAQCGKQITRLPFEPDPKRLGQLKCLDCFKASRPAR